MPKPLSRTQLVTVRLPSPPDPAVAARAPMSPQSIGCGSPEKLKKPVKVCHQCGSGTNAMLIVDQEQEDDRQHRPGEVLEHALDGAAERQDEDDARGSSADAIHACVAWSGAPGMRPIQAPNSVAAALPASAGQPS